MQPALGERINLQFPAFDRPLLAMQESKPLPTNGLKTATALARVDGNDPAFSAKRGVADASRKEQHFTTHLVSTKETLYSISKRYGVELEKIKEWNRLDGLDLKIGQELIIYKNNN
jgi:LysM repeat protein